MYTQFFRLTQAPFSISPDPRYLFMSERHREALAHLLYGVDSGGGLVLLTGDIGTGKTTICRCFLEQVPANCNVAYIFNPKLTVNELLQTICEEFHVKLNSDGAASMKDYLDALNRYLLAAHADGRNNVLIIDEAQNLSADVLEQLRLLTNLETNERKLLQIILIGQPELRTMLSRPELEQLAQRVIAHYHLTALSEEETASYIQHRLATAGLTTASPFQPGLMKHIHRLTNGVPRRINLLCDRAMLGAYATGSRDIDRNLVEEAAGELFINQRQAVSPRRYRPVSIALLVLGLSILATSAVTWQVSRSMPDDAGSERQASLSAPSNDELKRALQVSRDAHPKTAPANVAAPAAADAAQNPETPAPPRERSLVVRSEQDAVRKLLQIWNVAAASGDACETARENSLHCHRSNGGLAELRLLNRPAVLALYDESNKPFYAVLTELGNDRARLLAGDAERDVSLVELTRHFRGEFVLLWRAPPGFGKPIREGDTGPQVDWLVAQLAKINGTAVPDAGKPLGQPTLKQLRQFQQANGLFVDSITGPVTAMHINRVVGVEEPHLRAAQGRASAKE